MPYGPTDFDKLKWHYVAGIAGYVTDVGNHYWLATKYETAGPALVVVDCTQKQPIEVIHEPTSTVTEVGQKKAWDRYLQLVSQGRVPEPSLP